MGGTRFIGIFLSRLLVKEGHQVCDFHPFAIVFIGFSWQIYYGPLILSIQWKFKSSEINCLQVTLFTRGKAPIAQQLPGESDSDFADFSSKVVPNNHLKL